MPDYQNHNPFTVHLAGPDGNTITIPPRATLNLPEYFERYTRDGHIVRITPNSLKIRSGSVIQSGIQAREQADRKRKMLVEARRIIHSRAPIANISTRARVTGDVGNSVVGRAVTVDATDALRHAMARSPFPISNGVGVGVLSYNRAGSLRRLIDSITRYTDLNATTIFISDDGSTDQTTINYLDELDKRQDLVVLRNKTRQGVAGNTNRLLRCLSRFSHLLLLNDDVEITARGWDGYYREASLQTGFCHFVHQQVGVYGGRAGEPVTVNGRQLTVVRERPQGAVLSLTRAGLDLIGYMNERYGYYGMEHVDWSMRAMELGQQPPGFYDVSGSGRFFKVYSEASAVRDRKDSLDRARQVFSTRVPGKTWPSAATEVPSVTYIIPFRNVDRSDAIKTVINNIRAQRWPHIHILLVEQDQSSQINLSGFYPAEHLMVPGTKPLFNKSLAFNRAVSQTNGQVILHDADTMAQSDYTKAIMTVLQQHDACHIGARVIYADQESSALVASRGLVSSATHCDRVVGYYEGGSLACTTEAYWRAGGFNEDFWGYGCEDCDFYYRLSHSSDWKSDRTQDLLHLWHTRLPGWQSAHDVNKRLESSLRAMPLEIYLEQQRARVAPYRS